MLIYVMAVFIIGAAVLSMAMPTPTPANDPFADDPFLAALQHSGALSAKHALARSELPAIAEDLLAVFIDTDTVRETMPGRYYLVPRANNPNGHSSARFTPFSVTLMVAVWIVVPLVTIVVWLFSR